MRRQPVLIIKEFSSRISFDSHYSTKDNQGVLNLRVSNFKSDIFQIKKQAFFITFDNDELFYSFTAEESDNKTFYRVYVTDNETGATIASNACTLTVTSAAEPSAAPSTSPDQTPVEEEEDGELVITKSPTGESKKAGESATFISNADNYTSLEWRIVTADGSACWRNQAEITGKFGVGYNAYKGDDGREYLIPLCPIEIPSHTAGTPKIKA